MTSYKIDHAVCIDDRRVEELLLECRVLSHINISILRNKLHDVLHPCKNMFSIALLIFLVCVIDDVVKNDNNVLS